MHDGPTWGSLFERAEAFGADETAIRTTLHAIREEASDDS